MFVRARTQNTVCEGVGVGVRECVWMRVCARECVCVRVSVCAWA